MIRHKGCYYLYSNVHTEGESMSRQALAIALAVVVGAVVACTSSSTPTTPQSNQNYDASYREATRSSPAYGQTGTGQTPPGEAPITVMYVSLETGDVYPGEDYDVYAVVSNPDKRDVQYVWSVANGTIAEVPEADRGRLATVVDEGFRTAQATPPAQGPATEGAAGPGAGTPGVAGAGAPAGAGAGAAGTPAGAGAPPGAAPPGAALPGAVVPPAAAGAAGAAAAGPSQAGPPPDIQALIDKRTKGEALTTDEQARLDAYDKSIGGQGAGQPSSPAGQQTSMILERRVVGGPAGAKGADPAKTDEEIAKAQSSELKNRAGRLVSRGAAETGSAEPTRGEPTGAANIVEEGRPASAGTAGAAAETPSGATGKGSLRSQYTTWTDNGGTPRRRPLGATTGNEEESATLDAEKSYAQSTLTTKDPYIVWTPDTPGNVTIYVKVVSNEEDLTDPRELPVEVRLREPDVVIAPDFPDVVREDDDVLVRIDGKNLPAFYKGLVTVSFDPDVLSFRTAELGEFFDDATHAAIYYAQPSKTDGKVLIAVDSNQELSDLSGDGALVYLKFKAKRDIESQKDTQLALVADSSARYVLNRDGDNVVPLPVEHPTYRTDVIMPAGAPPAAPQGAPGQPAGAAGVAGAGAAGVAGVGAAGVAGAGAAGPLAPTGGQAPPLSPAAGPAKPQPTKPVVNQPAPGAGATLPPGVNIGLGASKVKDGGAGADTSKPASSAGGSGGGNSSALPLPVGPQKPAQKENVGPVQPKKKGSK